MSDDPQGPDWWQASNLKWYPPKLPAPPDAHRRTSPGMWGAAIVFALFAGLGGCTIAASAYDN